MNHLRNVFTKEKEEKAKFKLESKEKLKDDKKDKTKDKEKDKVKDKDKEKVKEKDKDKVKEKDKEKVKEKDKDKKEKKLIKMPSTVTSGIPFEEIFTLGVALPIFGVPLQQSVERSRCHDDTGLPLLIRDCIDYLEAHGLKSNQIYRSEADKIKYNQLRKLYMDRGPAFPYHWDVPVACAMLKSFLSELPESVLTQELAPQFEQVTALAGGARLGALTTLVARLPTCNRALLGHLLRHLDHVREHHQMNHMNVTALSAALAPALNMSQNLLTVLISKSEMLFPDIQLTKYVPPLEAIPADFPSDASSLSVELRKQESLLSQIHAEMHAGFITDARDQQLWEAQRIVTQLKRKLRAVQKSTEPNPLHSAQVSLDEKPTEDEPPRTSSAHEPSTSQQTTERDATTTTTDAFQPETTDTPQEIDASFDAEFEDNFDFGPQEIIGPSADVTDNVPVATEPLKEKPKLTEKEIKKLRLELENAEYLQLKSLLQAKINSEQFEIVKLRSQVALKNKQEGIVPSMKESKETTYTQEEMELKQKLMKKNAALEQKRLHLINQIFQERVACTQLKIELAMKELT